MTTRKRPLRLASGIVPNLKIQTWLNRSQRLLIQLSNPPNGNETKHQYVGRLRLRSDTLRNRSRLSAGALALRCDLSSDQIKPAPWDGGQSPAIDVVRNPSAIDFLMINAKVWRARQSLQMGISSPAGGMAPQTPFPRSTASVIESFSESFHQNPTDISCMTRLPKNWKNSSNPAAQNIQFWGSLLCQQKRWW